MYIVTRTADANPVLGPMSFLLTSIKHTLRNTAPTPVALTDMPEEQQKGD
jgi:hypothetical protein